MKYSRKMIFVLGHILLQKNITLEFEQLITVYSITLTHITHSIILTPKRLLLILNNFYCLFTKTLFIIIEENFFSFFSTFTNI